METLSDAEIDAGLAVLPGWRREGDAIVRDLELPSFPAAIDLVVVIAGYAEEADHHPDIDIRYRKLHIVLSTHDAGGITRRDLDLAGRIEAAAAAAA